jgi:DNA-binding NarL/FixJ family response regulator
MTGGRIRVLIVDDHPIVREGLRTLLREEGDIEIVGEAGDGIGALGLVLTLRPDVVLLDLVMPGLAGVEAIRTIKDSARGGEVLVLTSFAEEGQVRQAVAAGAAGYVLKDVLRDDLLQAIRNVHEGKPWLHPEAQRQLMKSAAVPPAPTACAALTRRERAVLEQVGRGRSNREIALRLGISEGTVKGYVSGVLAKLGLADRTQAALYAVRHDLIPPAAPADETPIHLQAEARPTAV